MAQSATRRGVVHQLEALGPAVRLLGVTRDTVRRWRSGELTPSALARAFLALLVLLQKGGVDLGALVRGDVRPEPYGPLAPRWEAEADDDEPEEGEGGASEAPAIAAPSVPAAAPQERRPEKEQAAEDAAPRSAGVMRRAVAAVAEAVMGDRGLLVRYRDGREERVSVLRAARLLRQGTVEASGEWTFEDVKAVRRADHERETRIAQQLADDGLLVGAGAGPVERPRFPWLWRL